MLLMSALIYDLDGIDGASDVLHIVDVLEVPTDT